MHVMTTSVRTRALTSSTDTTIDGSARRLEATTAALVTMAGGVRLLVDMDI
jgi:hypothetical protein